MDGLVQQPQQPLTGRFTPSSQGDLAPSGERSRIHANLHVIRLLRELEEAGRPANEDKRAQLARWSGWGAVPNVFDERKSEYAAERAELMELLSKEEYAAARRNIADVAADGRVYAGDLYDTLHGRVDVLVLNAPYVPTEEIGLLPAEARLHGPRVALDGGADGLDAQRRVSAAAPLWLAPGGHLTDRDEPAPGAADRRHPRP